MSVADCKAKIKVKVKAKAIPKKKFTEGDGKLKFTVHVRANDRPKPKAQIENLAPDGLLYLGDFLTKEEETELLDIFHTDVDTWTTAGARAKRVVKHYGYNYPYSRKLELSLADEMPSYLVHLVARITRLPGLSNFRPNQAIVNRYLTGECIGAHIDHEELFGDTIVSISIGSTATIRFRSPKGETHDHVIEKRSVYAMTRSARYEYTHEMKKLPKSSQERFSITFRRADLKYLKRGQIPHPEIDIAS